MPKRLKAQVTCSICKIEGTTKVHEFKARKSPHKIIHIYQAICDDCMKPDAITGQTIEEYLSETKDIGVKYVGLLT